MRTVARFRVVALLDDQRSVEAHVVIERATQLVTIRPHRRRKSWGPYYLGDLVSMMVRAEIRKDAAERAAKKRTRKVRRGRL